MAKKIDFSKVGTFVFDVDGVLSDGTVLCLASGEQARTFYIKDGYAIEQALRQGFKVAVISGGFQDGVKKRLEFLGIKDIFLGIKDKVTVFETYIKDNNINTEEVLYMGDDLPDYDVMKLAGICACPADAAEDILTISDYITMKEGGKGAVREVIERVMKVQKKWILSHQIANA